MFKKYKVICLKKKSHMFKKYKVICLKSIKSYVKKYKVICLKSHIFKKYIKSIKSYV